MAIKYTKERLEEAAANSFSYAGVIRFLGMKQCGGNYTHVKNQLAKFEINTDHFTGRAWNRGKISTERKTPAQILIKLPEGSRRTKVAQLRRALDEVGIERKCRCGLTDTWQDATLVLEVDHIDGDWLNNTLENLRYLCPNCHSQEPTSRSWKNTIKHADVV